MLEIYSLSSPLERNNLKSKFAPNEMTWVVSDLHSKFEIQNQIMKKQGYFEDQSVLRASELWRIILRRANPDFRIVSADFIKTILKEKLDSEHSLTKHKGEEVLMDILDSMIQVIEHPEGFSQIENWFKSNPSAQERWGIWFNLAYDYGKDILKQKMICQKWIASWLTNQIGWERFWDRPVIIDLAGELSRSESELFQILARSNDVILIEPKHENSDKFNFLLKPYEQIQGFAKKIHSSQSAAHKAQAKPLRFTGPLAEVKYATAIVRKWLENGINPQNIALISAEVESYWPILEVYFKEEGIPVAKDSTIKLHSIPVIVWWLSRLRVAKKSFEYADLEIANFQNEKPQLVRFEKFESLFKNILDESDLSRSQIIKKSFSDDFIPKEPISELQFIGIISRFWPEEASPMHLEFVMKEILQSVDDTTKMKFGNWIYWLEHLVGKKEIKINGGERDGVQIINLLSADSLEFTHRIFLGLTENQFKDKSRTLLSASDIEKIFSSTGFQINHPEQSSLQFQLEWISSYSTKEDYYCYPMTSASGAVEAPHPLWLKLSEGKEIQTEIPEPARFDSIGLQKEAKVIGAIREWKENRIESVQNQIDIDSGERECEAIMGFEKPTLSASGLETYHKCGFKFAAGKLFKLLDPAEVDLDTDARSLGQVVHKMFEVLTKEPRKTSWSTGELTEVLNKIYSELKAEKSKAMEHLGEEQLWPPQREKLVRLGLRFIEYENSENAILRKKTVAQELQFKLQMAEYSWVGVIDRVDELKTGGLVVYDYKAKNREYKIKKWLEKQHLQLGFYAWIIASGHIKEFSNQVVQGAVYYIYRDFSMLGINPESPKASEEFKSFFKELENKIEIFISGLTEGKFAPIPYKIEECKYCKWSRLCRAPHLN